MNENNGALLWSAPVANGDNSSPAVAGPDVYVTYPENYYAFNRLTGTRIWHDAFGGNGGGGRTPVVADGHLFIRDWAASPLISSATTGATQGPLASTTAPAIAGGTAYEMTGALGAGRLRAVSNDGLGATRWSFAGDGHLSSAPLVTSGAVWAGTTSGEIYALACRSGARLWSAKVGSPILAPDEQNVSAPLTGLGAGDNTLIVPAGSRLVAYRSAATAGAGSCGAGGSSPAVPGTKITSSNIATKRHRARFRFRAIGQATGFRCALVRSRRPLARAAFRVCRSPKTYRHLKKGHYVFRVRAFSASGSDSTPARKRFTIR